MWRMRKSINFTAELVQLMSVFAINLSNCFPIHDTFCNHHSLEHKKVKKERKMSPTQNRLFQLEIRCGPLIGKEDSD